jgi:hypothetical protein
VILRMRVTLQVEKTKMIAVIQHLMSSLTKMTQTSRLQTLMLKTQKRNRKVILKNQKRKMKTSMKKRN